MIKKLWYYLTEMVRIWFAPGFNLEYATTGRHKCAKPSAGRRGSVSKPAAYLTRRLAAGRGNKDGTREQRLELLQKNMSY